MTTLLSKKVYAYVAKTILETLSKDEIDLENILTFSIYMQLGILKCACRSINEVKVFSDSIYNYWLSNQNLIVGKDELLFAESELNSLFKENKELLGEICKDIWDPITYSTELGWLHEWDIHYQTAAKDSKLPEEICFEFINVINDNLETPIKNAALSLCLISKSLNSLP